MNRQLIALTLCFTFCAHAQVIVVEDEGQFDNGDFRAPAAGGGTVINKASNAAREDFILRNGTVWIAAGETFLSLGLHVDINRQGTSVFTGDVMVDDGNEIDEAVGVFKGDNPDLGGGYTQDTIDWAFRGSFDNPVINNDGDVAYVYVLQGNRSIKLRAGTDEDGEPRFTTLGPGGNPVISNGKVAWTSRDAQAGAQLHLAEYGIDNERIDVESNQVVLSEQASGYTSIVCAELTADGSLYATTTRTEPGGASGQALVRIAGAGQAIEVFATRELDPESSFVELGCAKADGENLLFYGVTERPNSDRIAGYFPLGSERPLLARNHLFVPGYYVDQIDGAEFAYADGQVVWQGALRDIPGQEKSSRGGIFSASGGTDFVPVTPQPSDFFQWTNADGGDFDTSANWDQNDTPDSDQIAVFDLNRTYTVNAGGERVGRLRFGAGNVTINGALEAIEANSNSPSLLIEAAGLEPPTVTLAQSSVNLEHARISSGEFGQGGLVVSSESALGVAQSMVVGHREEGNLVVRNGGNVNVKSLRVGGQQSGYVSVQGTGSAPSTLVTTHIEAGTDFDGFLFVEDGARLEVADLGLLYLGYSAGLTGQLRAFGDGTVVQVLQLIGLGRSGIGNMIVGAGAFLDAGYIGLGYLPGSEGTLDIGIFSDSSNASGRFTAFIIDMEGQGTSNVALYDEAVGEISEELRLSTAAALARTGHRNRLEIRDDARLTVPRVLIGDSSLLSIEERALLDSESGTIGTLSTVFIQGNGRWKAQDSIEIGLAGELKLQDSATVEANAVLLSGNGAQLVGNGRVIANVVNSVGGTVSTSLNISAPSTETGPKGLALSFEIDGDFSSNGGNIGIAAGGPSNADWARLHVTGDVSAEDTTIRLSFAPGYAPKSGDLNRILLVDGDLSIGIRKLEYAGIEEGFRYRVNSLTGGILEIEALNDGAAFAADTLFRSGFSGEFMTVID